MDDWRTVVGKTGKMGWSETNGPLGVMDGETWTRSHTALTLMTTKNYCASLMTT